MYSISKSVVTYFCMESVPTYVIRKINLRCTLNEDVHHYENIYRKYEKFQKSKNSRLRVHNDGSLPTFSQTIITARRVAISFLTETK